MAVWRYCVVDQTVEWRFQWVVVVAVVVAVVQAAVGLAELAVARNVAAVGNGFVVLPEARICFAVVAVAFLVK